MSRELHPLLRLTIERLEERGVRQRMLRERRRLALARPEARAEWDRAHQLRDLPAANAKEWADALVDVAEENGLDPTDARGLIALREQLLEPMTPERLHEFAGLLAVTDDVIVAACSAHLLRAQAEAEPSNDDVVDDDLLDLLDEDE